MNREGRCSNGLSLVTVSFMKWSAKIKKKVKRLASSWIVEHIFFYIATERLVIPRGPLLLSMPIVILERR